MAKTIPAAKPTVGALIDELYELREQLRMLNKQAKEVGEARDAIEKRLMEAMDAQGVEQSRGAQATATISETVEPQVEDWESYYRFIRRNNAFYLLQRRPAAAPYREMLAQRNGKPIPGVQSFIKRSVNLRTRNS